MSEYWKSNAKKYCEYCKVWITDNKPSIAIHESGKNHKDRVKAKLEEINKKADEKKIQDKMNQKTMAAIEQAALMAMKQDIESNPSLSKQYGSTSKDDFIHLIKPPETSKSSSNSIKDKKDPKKPHKTELENLTAKRKAEELPQAKIGKWEVVKEPNKSLEKIKPVDLQLPSKYDKKQLIQIEVNAEDTKLDDSKPKTVELKSKWVPISETQHQDQDVNTKQSEGEFEKTEKIKTESFHDKIVEETKEVKSENQEKSVQDDENGGEKEKVVSLKLGKKDKPITFKKRKVAETVQLRERDND